MTGRRVKEKYIYSFCVEEGNIVIKIGDWIPEGVSWCHCADLGAVREPEI